MARDRGTKGLPPGPVPPPPPRPKPRRPKPARSLVAIAIAESSSEERKEILWSVYEKDEESCATVAKLAGTTPEAVRTMFERMGKTLRPSTFREPKFYRAKAEAHRLEAKRFDAIADELAAFRVPSADLLTRTTGAT